MLRCSIRCAQDKAQHDKDWGVASSSKEKQGHMISLSERRYHVSLLRLVIKSSCLTRSGSPDAIIGEDFIDLILESRWMRSDQPTNLSTLIKDDEGWNSLNTILERNSLVLVGIHFGKAQFPLVFVAQFLVDGRDSATGTTPRGPEINDNWFIGFEYFCLKILVSNVEEVGMCIH